VAERDRGQVDLAAYVAVLATEQVTLRVPPPVDQRLDDLVATLQERVRKVGRGDIAAALIQAANNDVDELHATWRRYEDALAHETLGTKKKTGKYRLRAKTRGPQPRPQP
jgi:hypothetical protein